jgi:hypothetical protein
MADTRKILWIDGDKDAAAAVQGMDELLREMIGGCTYDFELTHHLVVPKPLPDHHDYRALIVEPRPIWGEYQKAPDQQKKAVVRAHPLYALMMNFCGQYKEVIVNTSMFEAELEDIGLRQNVGYTMFFSKHDKKEELPFAIAHNIID